MLKKILKPIRKQLLKIAWVKREVEAYRLEQKKQRHQIQWKLIMSGRAVRNLKPEKLEPHDTLAIVTDDGVIVEYLNGQVVGREYVNPNFVWPFGTRRDGV